MSGSAVGTLESKLHLTIRKCPRLVRPGTRAQKRLSDFATFLPPVEGIGFFSIVLHAFGTVHTHDLQYLTYFMTWSKVPGPQRQRNHVLWTFRRRFPRITTPTFGFPCVYVYFMAFRTRSTECHVACVRAFSLFFTIAITFGAGGVHARP